MSASVLDDRSQFRQALYDRVAIEVPMNGFRGVIFSETSCIGTDSLGGCAVVLILSRTAALMGHIPPHPDANNRDDLHAADENVRQFMDNFTKYYRQNLTFFRPDPNAWVICALIGGNVALPGQQEIMKNKLLEVQLIPRMDQAYNVETRRAHRDSGSVFVDSRGATIDVFVEGTLVHRLSRNQPSQATAVTSVATASPYYTATPSTVSSYATTSYPTAPLVSYTATPSTASAYATTPYSTAPLASSSTTPSVPSVTAPLVSSNSAAGAWWQWNAQTGQYEYRSYAGVQLQQPNPPFNIWVYFPGNGANEWLRWTGNIWSNQ